MILLGYYIRRTWTPPRGKTLCATTHRIFPTRSAAFEAMVIGDASGYLAGRWDEYDVAEVWLK